MSTPAHRTGSHVHQDDLIGERDLGDWRTPAGRWLARRALDLAALLGVRSAAGVVLLAGCVLTGVLALVAGRVYDAVVDQRGISALDEPALHEAMSLRTPERNHLVSMLSDIGGPTWMPVVSTVLAVGIALLWRTWLPVLLTAVAALGSLTMTIAGKDLIGRVRPPTSAAVPPYEHSPSFPSGHALNTTVIVGVLAYVALTRLESRTVRRVVVAAASAWIVLMGLSRVYLGHHWLTDVAMGWALGLTWVGMLVTAHRTWITARRDRAARASGPDARPDRPGGASVTR